MYETLHQITTTSVPGKTWCLLKTQEIAVSGMTLNTRVTSLAISQKLKYKLCGLKFRGRDYLRLLNM